MLQFNRSELHLKKQNEVTDKDKERFFDFLQLRKNSIPLEYITNEVSFYEDKFYVDERSLIPRSETEILVQKSIELIKSESIQEFVEIGVGSGSVLISILLKTKIKAIATDIKKEALEVAKINAMKFNVNTMFLCTDLLEGIDNAEFVISNPPYIANCYKLDSEVLHEPKSALFGGQKGHEVLERLIIQCSTKKIKFLACEIGYDQKEVLAKILESNGYEADFYKDYANFDRGFVARLNI